MCAPAAEVMAAMAGLTSKAPSTAVQIAPASVVATIVVTEAERRMSQRPKVAVEMAGLVAKEPSTAV